MELLASILTALLGLGGAPGVVIDGLAADALRQQLVRAEQLEVRVDNAPNYRIVQGQVDRVRVAGRGLYLHPALRIDTVDLETDPIDIDPASLRSGGLKLRQPLQAAVRVVLKAEDVNAALRSPDILPSLQGLRVELPGEQGKPQTIDVTDPQVFFLPQNRLRVTATLQTRPQPGQPDETLQLDVESGLRVVKGTRLELHGSRIALQGVAFPDEITDAIVRSLNRLVNLRQLEKQGIVARVLQLEVTAGQLQVVGFARIDPLPP